MDPDEGLFNENSGRWGDIARVPSDGHQVLKPPEFDDASSALGEAILPKTTCMPQYGELR